MQKSDDESVIIFFFNPPIEGETSTCLNDSSSRCTENPKRQRNRFPKNDVERMLQAPVPPHCFVNTTLTNLLKRLEAITPNCVSTVLTSLVAHPLNAIAFFNALLSCERSALIVFSSMFLEGIPVL